MKDFLEWVKSIPDLIIERLRPKPVQYFLTNLYPKVQLFGDSFILVYQQERYEFTDLKLAMEAQDYTWERGFESYIWEINGDEMRFVR